MAMKVLLILLLAYGGLALTARFLASRALYYPEIASRETPSGIKRVRDARGNEIATLHLPNPNASFTVWFFHGNAEALGDLEPTLRALHAAGYAVFAFDYPGYGISTGVPSESSLYASARAARTYLREELKVPAEQTLIYGRSLGSGPAVQMATEEKVGGLILQSAFVSVYRVITRWRILPFDLFENERKLAQVTSPVLIMHGRADEVIPFRHGEALFDVASEPKRHFWVTGARHNDFITIAGSDYWAALREFSDVCRAARAARP
jgi:fermentation-respiration switch protein FrsA (DUF1100 family)